MIKPLSLCLVGLAAVMLTGCGTVNPAGPVTSATATPSSPATTVSEPATHSSPATSVTSPTVSATATSPAARASATAAGPAIAALTCTPSVSGETGDPIIVISYQVTAPSTQRWTLTLRYTNDWGRSSETRQGRGDKSETFKAYGSVDSESKPDCRATIRRR